MNLKTIRENINLTQAAAAGVLGISLRSYVDYENDKNKENTLKYQFLCEKLFDYGIINEEHGILSADKIKSVVKNVFDKYKINFCYLFGSYAKNNANPKSDVDLLIDSEITGLDFYGLVEELRNELCKKVDLLKINQLTNNEVLIREILKDGIKIYG